MQEEIIKSQALWICNQIVTCYLKIQTINEYRRKQREVCIENQLEIFSKFQCRTALTILAEAVELCQFLISQKGWEEAIGQLHIDTY